MGSNCCKGDHAGRPARSGSSIYTRSRAGATLDGRFTTSEDARGVTLTVSAARTGDSGVYTLQASNAAGKDTACVRLEVSPDEEPVGEDPPTFLRRLQDLTVKVGTRTRFLVEILSSTECKVTWYRNERRLMEAERIALARDGNFWCADVAAVSVDDAGRWTCSAENAGGRASCSAHLNVLVPKAYKRPEFVEELRALLTEQGTVSLECKVVGVPTPVLRWFKDSCEIKAGDVFALTANAEDPTSLGTYTCEAVNCMGRAYSSSKVHVVGRDTSRPGSGGLTPEPPPIFTKELEGQFVKISCPLTLSCHIVVPPWPRSVVWYNKEGKVDPSERYHVIEDGVGGYLIEVVSAEYQDEGEWKCVATSAGGRVGISTCYVTMDVPKNYRKPRFMENLQAVLTEEGLVSFECKVVGFPTPVLSWFKDGQELKPGDVYQLTGTNSLGSYCCIARNCMGQASSSAELTVEDIQNQLNEEEKLQLFSKNQAPKFVQGLKSVEAKIDEPFRFTIKVAIPPEPSVLWYRDDQPVDESTRCHLSKEERGAFALDISNLEFLDQAEWKCVAMNDFGHSVTSCFLKLMIPRHYKKPRFLENLQAILSDEGAVNLECKVIGVPQPILKWYKDGEELKPGDIHRIISGQDGTCCLGTYTCEARNCMGIAASSASLLGFEESMKQSAKKKAEEQALQRNLSLSTIHEERTSQMYDTPVGDITLDDKGEISFSFDGKEVSVSLYETPDLTEEEALQIVEMYADQLSENVTEHNVVELPPLRFVKETSTSGNLLMEAIIIDVSPEYFASPEEDLRTEADVEEISIADESLLVGVPQLSLDADIGGEDYLDKTLALMTDEKADIPKKLAKLKSESVKSGEDFFSLSRDPSLTEDKGDDDTQVISESELRSYESAHSISKAKSLIKTTEIVQPSLQQPFKTTEVIAQREEETSQETGTPVLKPKRERRTSRGSRRSSSGSEKSVSRAREELLLRKAEIELQPRTQVISDEEFKLKLTELCSSIEKVINDVQIIEREIILKSELMSSAATASRSLEIISSLITPFSEIHSIAEASKESALESKAVCSSLITSLPQSLKTLQQSLTIIEKCIDVESETKTLVKKTCVAFIETCGSELIKIMSALNSLVKSNYLTMDDRTVSDLDVLSNDIIHVVKFTTETIKTRHIISEAIEIKQEEPSVEAKHLRDTQKAVFELKSPLSSLLCIAESAEGSKVSDVSRVKSSEVILTDMSASIQDLQSALEQIELLSVKESTSSLHKYNTEIIESVVESVLNLRTSFEQLSTESKSEDDKTVLMNALTSIKQNLNELSLQINTIESNIGTFDILQSDNKLEVLQRMAQILIALENNISRLETLPEIKAHIGVFHKNLTKVLEKVIESNEAKKYIALIEICDVVNRINSSIKNIDSDTTLSLASLSNTMKIIKDHFVKNIFDSELNCAILSNIADVYVSIQEALSQAEEMSVTIDSEHIEDLSNQNLDVTKANVAVEHIEQTIAAINNIKIVESTGILKTTYTPIFEKICPILEELKQNIGSVRSNAAQTEEHVSELSEIDSARLFATPLCELHQNIIVLSRLVTENVESLKENSTISSTVAEPLQELRSTLEIIQQDVISQYKEDVMPLEVSIQIANAVQDLHSCILMIEEKAEVEGAEELSTLEDISGIKTTAESIPSDRLVLPSAEEATVQSSLEPFIEQEAPSATARALQSLNDHITILQNQDVIDALDTLSEVSDYSSLKSVALGLGDLHSGIEEILHPFIMENAIELKSTLNTSKLSAIAEPMQDLQQSLSILDTTNIPIYEHILEMSSDKIHSVFQSIFEFKERLDKCIQAVFPAMETADKTIEISNKVEALRGVCENLKNIIESTKLNSPDTSVNDEVFILEDTINSLLDATDVSKGIKIELVKSITEELFAKALTAKEEIIKFTPQTPENLLQEAKLIQTIDEVESNIAVLEQYDFVDLSRTSDLTTCASPQLAIEFETSSLQQLNDVVENAVNVLQDANQGKSEADFMIVDDFFRTCKNEFTILKLLLSKKMSHKRIIRLLQEFSFLQRTVSDFKGKQAELNLSEEMNDHVSTFLANANECLEKIQESLTTVVESQSNLLFDLPVEKLKGATESLKEVKKCKNLEPILEVIVCLENVITLAIPFIQDLKQKVIEEIKQVDVEPETINISLVEKMEDFEILVQETALYSLNEKSNIIVRNLQASIQKHMDYKEATKSGKALIISKCLAECLGIILEKDTVTIEPSEIIIVEHKAEESALKIVLTEMIVPLQTLHNQLICVQEQISSGVEEDAISVDMTSTESVMNTMTEICKDVVQIEAKINEGGVIDHDDIALVLEVDKEIQTISDSLKLIESIPAVKEIREALKPIEQIEKSLQVILSSDAVSADKKPRLSKEKSTELIQHIDQYIELTEIVEEMSAFIREEQIKESVNIARELRESIAASEDINIEGGGEVSSEVRTEQARLAQQLHEALSALQVHAIEKAHEIGQPVSEKALLRITETASQLQTNLVAVASIDSAVTDTTTISSETLKAQVDDNVMIENVEALTSFKEDTYDSKEITKLEDESVKASIVISEETSEIEKSIADKIAAQAPLGLEVLTEHIDELLSDEVSETVKNLANTLNSEHLKGFLEVAKEIRMNISALETVSEPLEATKLIEETVSCQNVLKQDIQQSLSSLENVILENAQEKLPSIKSEDLIKVKEVIMHIQEDLDFTTPSTSKDYEIVLPDKSTPEVSMTCLQDLLQRVNDKINLPPEERSLDDMDSLVDILDEVQTVLIKLKCDYDGAGNDTLNENLEDLECSVRSFQLQINEESPPVMLKEACVTLQLLANAMSEAYEINKASLKTDEGASLTDKCVVDSEESLKLLDLAANVRTEIPIQLENIVSGLDSIKENMKSLKSRFMGQAESIIENGIDIIQRLNQIEDQVFSLEKDLESTERISVVVRDSIIAAVHSVYGSISNMRSTISSIQKKYMYENYGKPSENLLHSIKNATLISRAMNNECDKIAWKNFSKSLRNMLNHFEDIKFYINLDKTARLPSDAAFTKIILDELNSNISATICLFNTSESEDKNNFENLLKTVKDIKLDIETRTTLEVKEKIPMLKLISLYVLAVTESRKLSITNKQISTNQQIELSVQLVEEKEYSQSEEIIAEELLHEKQDTFEAAIILAESKIAANDFMTIISESTEPVDIKDNIYGITETKDIDKEDIIEPITTEKCVEEATQALLEGFEKDKILEFKEIAEQDQQDDKTKITETEEDQAEKELLDEARAIDSTDTTTDEVLSTKVDIGEELELGLEEKVSKVDSDKIEEKALLTETSALDTANTMLTSSDNLREKLDKDLQVKAVPHTESSDVSEKVNLDEAKDLVTIDTSAKVLTPLDTLQKELEKVQEEKEAKDVDSSEIAEKERSEKALEAEMIDTVDTVLLTSDKLEEREKDVEYIDFGSDAEKERLNEARDKAVIETVDESASTSDKLKEELEKVLEGKDARCIDSSDVSEKVNLDEAKDLVTIDTSAKVLTPLDTLQKELEKVQEEKEAKDVDSSEIAEKERSEKALEAEMIDTVDTVLLTSDKLDEREKDVEYIDFGRDVEKERLNEAPDKAVIETADESASTSDKLKEELEKVLEGKDARCIDSSDDAELVRLEEVRKGVESEDIAETVLLVSDKLNEEISKDSIQKALEQITSRDLAEVECLEVVQADQSIDEAKAVSPTLEIMKEELEKDLEEQVVEYTDSSDVTENAKLDKVQVLECRDTVEAVLSTSDNLKEETEKSIKEKVVEFIDSRDVAETQRLDEVQAEKRADKAEAVLFISDKLEDVIEKDIDEKVVEHITSEDSVERESLEVMQADEGIEKAKAVEKEDREHKKKRKDEEEAVLETSDTLKVEIVADVKDTVVEYIDSKEFKDRGSLDDVRGIKIDTTDVALSVSHDHKEELEKDLQKITVEECGFTKSTQEDDSSLKVLIESKTPENVETDFKLKKVSDEESLTIKPKSPLQTSETTSDEAVKFSDIKTKTEIDAEDEVIVISESRQEIEIIDLIDKKIELEELEVQETLQEEKDGIKMVEEIKFTSQNNLDEVESGLQGSESIESQNITEKISTDMMGDKDKAETVQDKKYEEALETHDKQKETLCEEVVETVSMYDKVKDEESLKFEAQIPEPRSTSEEMSQVTEISSTSRKATRTEEEKVETKISESTHETRGVMISDIVEKPIMAQAMVQQEDISIDKNEFASGEEKEMIEKQRLVSQLSESQKDITQTEIKVTKDQTEVAVAKHVEEVVIEEIKPENVIHLENKDEKITDFDKESVKEHIAEKTSMTDKQDELIRETIDMTSDATEIISDSFQIDDSKVLPDKHRKEVSLIDMPISHEKDKFQFEAGIEVKSIEKVENDIVITKEELDLVKHEQDLKKIVQEKLVKEQTTMEEPKDLGAPKKDMQVSEHIEPQSEETPREDKTIAKKHTKDMDVEIKKEKDEQEQEKKIDTKKETADAKLQTPEFHKKIDISETTEIREDIKLIPEKSKEEKDILKKSICEEKVVKEETIKAEPIEKTTTTKGDTLIDTSSLVIEKKLEDVQAKDDDISKESEKKYIKPEDETNLFRKDETHEKRIETELTELVAEGREKFTDVPSKKQKEVKKESIKVSKKKDIKQKVDQTLDAHVKKDASEIEFQPDVNEKMEITKSTSESTEPQKEIEKALIEVQIFEDKPEEQETESDNKKKRSIEKGQGQTVDETIAFGKISEKFEKTETVDVIKTIPYMQEFDKAKALIESSLATAEVIDKAEIITDSRKENADLFLEEVEGKGIVTKETIQVHVPAEKEIEEFSTKTELQTSHMTSNATLKDSKKKAITEKETGVEIAFSEDKLSFEKVIEESNKSDQSVEKKLNLIEEKSFQTQEKIDAMPIEIMVLEDKKIKHDKKYDDERISFDTQDLEPKIPKKIEGKKDIKELDKKNKETEKMIETKQKKSIELEHFITEDVVQKTVEPEHLKEEIVKMKSDEISIKKVLPEKDDIKTVPKESVGEKIKDSEPQKPSSSSKKTEEMISTEKKDGTKETNKLTKKNWEKEIVGRIPDKPETVADSEIKHHETKVKSDVDQVVDVIDEKSQTSKSIETLKGNEEIITEVKVSEFKTKKKEDKTMKVQELKTEKPKKIQGTLATVKVEETLLYTADKEKIEAGKKLTEKVKMEVIKPHIAKETAKMKEGVVKNGSINGNKEKVQTETIPTTVTTEDYIRQKHKEVDKPRFIDRTHKDYTSEFIRPSDYRDKQADAEDQLKTFGKNITIYKAQTIVLESQLRSSVPPQSEFLRSTESADRRSDVRRSKALSEARSVMSEKRTSMSRDSKRKPVFSTYLTDRTAVEGSRVKLTCSVLSSSDPKITWFKSGAPLDNKLKYRTKYVDGLITMEVLNAVPSDSAEYSCNVENDNGAVSTSAILKVYPSFEASPIPPTFTRSIRDTYHLAENELVLECRIRGQPLPTITWFKNDKPVGINERYQAYYLADGVCRLAITHPTPEDSGKYTCKAENSVWSDQITHVVNFTGKEMRLSPNLSTVEKTRFNRHAMESRRPHFTNVLTDYKVAKGGTIGLQVEIKGFPTKVEWLREGQEVTEVYRNAKTFVEHGLYTLALADVTEKESGMYTCRAWSSHGNVDMNAAITVVQPNELDGKPAIIVGRPEKDILISVGEDINISFRVQGEPKPKVVFMKGTRDITNSQRVCKMTSDDYVKFTLKRSVVSDAGTYCILTRNAYGCDRAFVTVEIRQRASSENLISDWTYPDDAALSISDRGYKSVPERIPGEPSVVNGGNNWVAISWTKPEQGVVAPVLAYKVESWLLGKEGGARWVELGITPLTAFDAFNLKQGELYHFRVTPRNRFGWGESSQTSKPVGIGLVGERPEFVDILPGQLKVLVGETANLTCSVKGKPVPEIVWMKNGHEVEEEEQRVSMSYNGSDCCLVIKGINEEDEARYSCEASNEHGRASTYARLAVVTDRQIWEADAKLKRERSSEVLGEFPPQFTMRLRDRRVQSTYPVRLTCQVVGNPNPNVTWFKDGQSVNLDNRRTASQDEHFHTLEIAPTNLEDGGVYEAMARNGCGAVSCRCSLVVDKGIRAYIAPEFCCGLEPLYRLNEGDELRISAVVEAYPSVGVTWFRDGVRLRPSRRAIMTLDRDGQIELALAFVTVRDAGVYSCIASNEVGRATTSGKVEIIGDGLPLEKKRTPPMLFSPDVPYSQEPMFIRKPRSSEAREGDTVIIQCEVVGDPKPDVYWLRDFLKPDYYRDASHFKRVGSGSEYRFEIPHAKFDYTGTYSVIAKNVHGEAKAIISLQILAKDPSASEDSHSVSYGRVDVLPGFERELTDLLCHDGDAVEFECRVTGQPTPDIKWFHYSDLIRDCDYLETSFEEGTARLKIKQVTGEDEGTYCCQASNNLGKSASTACLVVYPPGEPNTLSQRLRRPPALSAASTPRSTPARSMSRATTPAPVQERRTHSPSRQVAPKFYTYPFNKVVDEGDCVSFQCAVKGLPAPWATWDKDGVIITPSARITIKEKDDMMRILEIDEVSIDDVGLYRITLENDYGRVEASARLEVISHKGKFYAGVKGYSPSPRRLNYRRRSSTSKQD